MRIFEFTAALVEHHAVLMVLSILLGVTCASLLQSPKIVQQQQHTLLIDLHFE